MHRGRFRRFPSRAGLVVAKVVGCVTWRSLLVLWETRQRGIYLFGTEAGARVRPLQLAV